MAKQIHDGYTRHAFIKGIKHFYPDIHFDFRPCTIPERYEWSEKLPKGTPTERADNVAKLLRAKIVSWSLADEKGTKYGINPANLLNPAIVDPNLASRMMAIVLGLEAWDEPPEATEDEKDEFADDNATAAATGRPFGEVQEAREQKN